MNAVIIASSLLVSRILGVLREVLLARTAGTGFEKNALDLAFLIPDILNHVVSTGFLSIIFIPVFTGYLVRQEDAAAWRFFSRVFNALALLFLVVAIPAWIWMKPLVLLLSRNDPSPEILDLAVHYGRIVLPAQICFLAGTFLVAVQHVRQRFLIPSLTGVVYNLAIVVGGILGAGHGLAGFAWGVPVGAMLGFVLLQLWGVRGSGVRWRLSDGCMGPEVTRYLKLMLPLALGVGAMFALEFVIRSYGSKFEGGVSSLGYAYRVMYTLVAVFGFSVGVAGYPTMARMAKEGRTPELTVMLRRTLGRMASILVPALLAVGIAAVPIVRVLFQRGAFTAEDTLRIAELLRDYLPASIGLCAQVVLVRGFYAHERMWLPTLASTGVFLVSLPFYDIFDWLGASSVPLVGGVSSITQVLVLALLWQRSYGWGKSLWKDFLQPFLVLVVLGGVLCGIPLPEILRIPGYSVWVSSLVAVLAAVPVFLAALGIQVALGSDHARDMLAMLYRRVVRKGVEAKGLK